MSHKHDNRVTVKLTPETAEELRKFHEMLNLPISLTAFTNWVLVNYGLPSLRDSQLFKEAKKTS